STRLQLRLLLRSLDASPEAIAAAPAELAAANAGDVAVPAEVGAAIGATAPARRRAYEMITSQEALDAWVARLAAAPLISFDTETDSLDYMRARLVGVS